MGVDGVGGGPVIEDHLRAAFAAVAADVQVEPVSIRKVSGGWRRRYRRRRCILAVLAAIVFGVVDVIGLWALNSTESRPGPIFSDHHGSVSGPGVPVLEWP